MPITECISGKMVYPSFKVADQVAQAYNRSHRFRSRAYWCNECGYYHTGRVQIRRRKPKERKRKKHNHRKELG